MADTGNMEWQPGVEVPISIPAIFISGGLHLPRESGSKGTSNVAIGSEEDQYYAMSRWPFGRSLSYPPSSAGPGLLHSSHLQCLPLQVM